MSELVAIAYVSTATNALPVAAIEALLADARAFNQRTGVTGALLQHDRTFFQYIEGPPDGVAQAYRRILASRAHRDLFELFHGPVPHRSFSAWLMGFTEAPASTLLQLEQAQWRRAARSADALGSDIEGLELLLQFWRNARRQVG